MATLQGVDVPGEENRFEYIPRGVTAVIAPWNFPLAILTGMTTAALVTGNTVVMKPAEQSPVVAAKLMEIFAEVGLPPGVLNYLPGRGETAGARLVEHPDVAVIAFTGSRDVGLAINARAAEVSRHGLASVKHVIAEMGGKNAIIVDDDADLDEAVLGVMKSAFGYQGQKCSACSRAIVLPTVCDAFLERLVEASRSLKIGPAEDPGTSVGPLIDEEALARVRKYIQLGAREGRTLLAADVGPLADEGYYIGPHIFADVPSDAAPGPGGSFRAGAGRDPGSRFRRCAADRQRHRICAYRRDLFSQPGTSQARPAGAAGRQSVPESWHYRGPGRTATVWRISPVGHRHQGRRPRLSAAIRLAPHDHRTYGAARLRSAIAARGRFVRQRVAGPPGAFSLLRWRSCTCALSRWRSCA